MITAFAVRLQDATDLDAVRADLTSTVHRALEPAHLSLWLGRAEPVVADARRRRRAHGRRCCRMGGGPQVGG